MDLDALLITFVYYIFYYINYYFIYLKWKENRIPHIFQ